MRYYSSSKSLEISLGLSILLHLFLFVYIKSPKPFKKVEPSPISVEYLSIPEEERLTIKPPAGAVRSQPNVSNRRTEASEVKLASPPKGTELPEPVESPAPEVAKEPVQFPYTHPTEVSEASVKPNLFLSQEQLAKIDKERLSIDVDGFKKEATISLQEPDMQYASYIRKVGEKIEGVWKYPEKAKKESLQGRGIISFTLNRQGELIDVKILKSAGPILDEAIMDAVKKAAKYYPFQDNMPVELLHIEATFEYYLISPGYIWIR